MLPLSTTRDRESIHLRMSPRLPDLSTVVALMFTATLTVWLGLWGPIELARLKEWQTLMAAIIAPSIALLAAMLAYKGAMLAYKGAMAKVDLDRAVHDAEQQRRRKSLMTKVYYATLMFRADLNATIRRLDPLTASVRMLTPSVTRGDLAVAWPPEFQEAWENLNLSDGAAAHALAHVKHNHNLLDAARADSLGCPSAGSHDHEGY